MGEKLMTSLVKLPPMVASFMDSAKKQELTLFSATDKLRKDIYGVRILGAIKDIERIVDTMGITKVVIAMPSLMAFKRCSVMCARFRQKYSVFRATAPAGMNRIPDSRYIASSVISLPVMSACTVNVTVTYAIPLMMCTAAALYVGKNLPIRKWKSQLVNTMSEIYTLGAMMSVSQHPEYAMAENRGSVGSTAQHNGASKINGISWIGS